MDSGGYGIMTRTHDGYILAQGYDVIEDDLYYVATVVNPQEEKILSITQFNREGLEYLIGDESVYRSFQSELRNAEAIFFNYLEENY